MLLLLLWLSSTSGWWDDPLEVHCDFKKWGTLSEEEPWSAAEAEKKALTIGFETIFKPHKLGCNPDN